MPDHPLSPLARAAALAADEALRLDPADPQARVPGLAGVPRAHHGACDVVELHLPRGVSVEQARAAGRAVREVFVPPPLASWPCYYYDDFYALFRTQRPGFEERLNAWLARPEAPIGPRRGAALVVYRERAAATSDELRADLDLVFATLQIPGDKFALSFW